MCDYNVDNVPLEPERAAEARSAVVASYHNNTNEPSENCVAPIILSFRITMNKVYFHWELSAIDCVFGSLSVVSTPVEVELPEQEFAVSFQRRSCCVCASGISIEGLVHQPVLACTCIAPASCKNVKNIFVKSYVKTSVTLQSVKYPFW